MDILITTFEQDGETVYHYFRMLSFGAEVINTPDKEQFIRRLKAKHIPNEYIEKARSL